VLLLIGVLFLCGGVGELSSYGASLNTSASTDTSTKVASIQQSTDVQAALTQAPQPTPTQKPKPTPKPAPTQSPAQVEQTYKSSTLNATVIDLDKQGNNDQYQQVHFTVQILNFVKDDKRGYDGVFSTSLRLKYFTIPLGTPVWYYLSITTLESQALFSHAFHHKSGQLSPLAYGRLRHQWWSVFSRVGAGAA
jgi:hypothetical protein